MSRATCWSFAAPRRKTSRFLHGPAAELLWPMRSVLLAGVLLHVLAAYQLKRLSDAAWPRNYLQRVPQVSNLASRLMRWGGVLLFVIIVVHILHFTTGTLRPVGAFVRGDVSANLVGSFKLWWVALFYIVAVAFLGVHLYLKPNHTISAISAPTLR